jgi:hypothetical protein
MRSPSRSKSLNHSTYMFKRSSIENKESPGTLSLVCTMQGCANASVISFWRPRSSVNTKPIVMSKISYWRRLIDFVRIASSYRWRRVWEACKPDLNANIKRRIQFTCSRGNGWVSPCKCEYDPLNFEMRRDTVKYITPFQIAWILWTDCHTSNLWHTCSFRATSNFVPYFIDAADLSTV